MIGHVVLTGLPGAGKTSVGRLVARALGRDFVDLDARVQEMVGMDIPAIFERHGEPTFRRLEAEALREALARRDPAIIAAGGGALVSEESRRLALRDATVVWLRATPEAASARCDAEGSGRPLLAQGDTVARMRALLGVREAQYAEAHAVIDTDGSTPDEVAQRIVESLGGAP